MAVLLSGCTVYDNTTTWLGRSASSAFAGVASVGDSLGAPWGSTRPGAPSDSLTVQRVRGVAPSSQPLLPEEGNVWPAPEAPRSTLRNPDQALRGIPTYTPAVGEPQQAAQPQPRNQRRGTGGPFVPPAEVPQPQSALPPLVPLPPVAASVPVGAPGGSVVQTPQGGLTPATRVGNVETFNQPGVGPGTITRDGNNVTISRPGEAPVTVPAPR
jgi:hypothetical protein